MKLRELLTERLKYLKVFKNRNNTVQYGVMLSGQRYLVTKWTSDDGSIKQVDEFPFDGNASGKDGKAAKAMALGNAASRIKQER